jgi:hypothetical protein
MKIISLIKAMVPICLAVCIVSVSSSADAKATEDEWAIHLIPIVLVGSEY